jgi:uncharacterized protein YukJ
MGLKHYGVLRGRASGARREDDADTPHYQIRVAAAGVDYRLAVNVKSQLSPSELLFLLIEDFRHPLTEKLPALAEGFTPLPKEPGGAALDFIRGNLFNRLDMRLLPSTLPGPVNDLSDRLAHYVDRAQAEPGAIVYAFGERWGPERGKPDQIFRFEPGNGVHDIHMNQGNDPGHRGEDGVWQDGGLIQRFPATDQWVAIFLAFQSQAWHTDDATGHRLPGPTPGPGPTPHPSEPDFRVRIVAALVNPIGPAPEAETVNAAQCDAPPDRFRRLAPDRQVGTDPGAGRRHRRRGDVGRGSGAAAGARQQGRDADPGRCWRAQGRRRRLHQGRRRGGRLDDRLLT